MVIHMYIMLKDSVSSFQGLLQTESGIPFVQEEILGHHQFSRSVVKQKRSIHV